jgi:hypothetical protein
MNQNVFEEAAGFVNMSEVEEPDQLNQPNQQGQRSHQAQQDRQGRQEGMGTEEGEGIVVDLSDVGDGKYSPVPRGIYPVTVVTLDYGLSQRSQNPMWTWVWEVEEGHEHAGRKFFYHTVFNEGGMPRVKRTLARIKADGDAQARLLSGPFNPQAVADEGILLGARARIRIDIRRYEGQNRNDVRDVLPPADQIGGGMTAGFAGV